MFKEIKCKNCRKLILNQDSSMKLINAHNISLKLDQDRNDECPSVFDCSNLYLSEDTLPDWIKARIESEEWSKGRLNCPYCDSRIGGFDFVSGMKCSCARNILPSIHLIRSKIDSIK